MQGFPRASVEEEAHEVNIVSATSVYVATN